MSFTAGACLQHFPNAPVVRGLPAEPKPTDKVFRSTVALSRGTRTFQIALDQVPKVAGAIQAQLGCPRLGFRQQPRRDSNSQNTCHTPMNTPSPLTCKVRPGFQRVTGFERRSVRFDADGPCGAFGGRGSFHRSGELTATLDKHLRDQCHLGYSQFQRPAERCLFQSLLPGTYTVNRFSCEWKEGGSWR